MSTATPGLRPKSGRPDKAATGRVFDISRGCFEDGPGLRTVVFLKGCNLDCPWCHNLEGKSFRPQIAFDRTRCIGCGTCALVCTRDWPGPDTDPDRWRPGCTACGRCTEVCPARARRLSGRVLDINSLIREIAMDRDFIDGTGGGVTFSGGEPLAQPGFLFACARALKNEGVHLAVETSGYWPGSHVKTIVREFDLVLFDLKHVDLRKCRAFVGSGSRSALENLNRLLETKVELELRVTLVPGFNDSADDLQRIADWLESCARRPNIRLLPFHRMATAKQHLLGQRYPYAARPAVTEDQLNNAVMVFRNSGFVVAAV